MNQRQIQDQRPGPVSTLVLSDVTLTGADIDDATSSASIETVGALTLDGATITDNAFSGKRETSAAVAIQGSGAVTITDSIIENTVNGAAIVDSGSGGSFTIVASSIRGNDGNGVTSAISAFSRPLVITDAEIVDNHDPDTPIPTGPEVDPEWTEGDFGTYGAIAAHQLTLQDVTVARNTGGLGGGVFAGMLTATDSTFEHNVSFLGGGASAAWADVDNSSFIENVGGLVGGGLHLRTCDGEACPVVASSITSTTIAGNLASSGGGFSMEPHTAPGHTGLDIDRSTFSRNRSYGGAGIQLDDVATPVSIEASTIAGNLPGVYLGPLSSEPQAELATTAYSGPGPTPLTVTATVVASSDLGMDGCVWEAGVPVS
ncbi:MAG: hypothetical protein KDB33_15340, partial [Acidimicrobiales bacterium]|nr:hypothetical protein [Acidimicrobiales bacterium]